MSLMEMDDTQAQVDLGYIGKENDWKPVIWQYNRYFTF